MLVGKVAASWIFRLKFELQRNCLNCSYKILHTCSECYGLHFCIYFQKIEGGYHPSNLGFWKKVPFSDLDLWRIFGQQQSCSGWKISTGGKDFTSISQCMVIYWVRHPFSKVPKKIGNAHFFRTQIWAFLTF